MKWKKCLPVLEIALYLILYVFCFGSAVLFVCNLIGRPVIAKDESWVTVAGTIASSVLAYAALRQARVANKINERLTKIEEQRDEYSLRPFVMIGNGVAGKITESEAIVLARKHTVIYIGGEPQNVNTKDQAYCYLLVEFINTTDHYLRVRYKSAKSRRGGESWALSIPGGRSHVIPLAPGEKKEMLFYGGKDRFCYHDGYEMKLILENRYCEAYCERIVLYLMGYCEGDGKRMPHVHLISQNYEVERIKK